MNVAAVDRLSGRHVSRSAQRGCIPLECSLPSLIERVCRTTTSATKRVYGSEVMLASPEEIDACSSGPSRLSQPAADPRQDAHHLPPALRHRDHRRVWPRRFPRRPLERVHLPARDAGSAGRDGGADRPAGARERRDRPAGVAAIADWRSLYAVDAAFNQPPGAGPGYGSSSPVASGPVPIETRIGVVAWFTEIQTGFSFLNMSTTDRWIASGISQVTIVSASGHTPFFGDRRGSDVTPSNRKNNDASGTTSEASATVSRSGRATMLYLVTSTDPLKTFDPSTATLWQL